MKSFGKSTKLERVCYDIRGPVLKEAKRLEEEGFKVLKLNIGNPATFGFDAPDEIVHDVAVNLRNAQGYCDSQGLFQARKAIMQDFQAKGVRDVGVDDIFIGNGVSELIVLAMQGLLNPGDQVLVPAPDYPLWTAAVTLAGGEAVHYRCDEAALWQPDLADLREKVTDRTVALVIINPNNPTGAVYERDILEGIAQVAREKELLVFSDEIYDRIVYDDAVHIPFSTVAPDLVVATFNGLSKAYRAAGFRAGWMALSGNKRIIAGYREGLEMLSNMRLCANVPAQYAIQTALGGYQSIRDLVLPSGRLRDQRDLCLELVNAIPGLSCVKPRGALYCFPRIDAARFRITDDERFVMDLLREKRILLVQGTGFNWPEPDHFRIVFLPDRECLTEALSGLSSFLSSYIQD